MTNLSTTNSAFGRQAFPSNWPYLELSFKHSDTVLKSCLKILCDVSQLWSCVHCITKFYARKKCSQGFPNFGFNHHSHIGAKIIQMNEQQNLLWQIKGKFAENFAAAVFSETTKMQKSLICFLLNLCFVAKLYRTVALCGEMTQTQNQFDLCAMWSAIRRWHFVSTKLIKVTKCRQEIDQ